MLDEVLVGTNLTGGVHIDLGNKRIVRPGVPVRMPRVDLMKIGGIEKMLKSGKLVIIEEKATEPVAPVVPPVEPPKAPEPVVEAPVAVEEPAVEVEVTEEAPKKKSKKARGVQTDAVVLDEAVSFQELETPVEEPKE